MVASVLTGAVPRHRRPDLLDHQAGIHAIVDGDASAARSTAGIEVVGHGTASAAPDVVWVVAIVESRDRTVERAYGRAGKCAGDVVRSLRASGVRPADITTSGLTVAWNDAERSAGYAATISVAFGVRGLRGDLDIPVARVVDSCISAGGGDVSLGGCELGFSDQGALVALARDQAWQDAVAKAEQLAGMARVELDRVAEITEDAAEPRPRPLSRGNKTVASALPVERGDAVIAVDIRVRWHVRPRQRSGIAQVMPSDMPVGRTPRP